MNRQGGALEIIVTLAENYLRSAIYVHFHAASIGSCGLSAAACILWPQEKVKFPSPSSTMSIISSHLGNMESSICHISRFHCQLWPLFLIQLVYFPGTCGDDDSTVFQFRQPGSRHCMSLLDISLILWDAHFMHWFSLLAVIAPHEFGRS